MTITSIISKYTYLIVLALLLIGSCNEGDNKAPETNTMTGENTESGIVSPASFSGKLDTLWTDSATFVKLANSKLVFAFIFEDSVTETLHGWSEKPGDSTFNTNPDIKLTRGRQSTLAYGRGTYFGNVNLKEVNKIQQMLKKENARYVIFAPKLYNNHIEYRIHITNDDPRNQKAILGLIDTGFDANPSPPKKY